MTTNVILMNFVRSKLGQGGSVFQKWAGIPGQAWCDAFISYSLNKTDNGSLYCNGAKEINCPHSMNWCYENLALIPIYLALPGDVTFFDWEPNGLPNHVGFVEERISADYYYTIEGNTAGGKVARQKRSDAQEQATFRLHYTPTSFSADKKLEEDGLFGYNSIAVMQRWLKACGLYTGDIDAIWGQGTMKALQKKLGVPADGLFGKTTAKALQKLVGATQDGLIGPGSVKAFQKYLNAHAFTDADPQPAPAPVRLPVPSEAEVRAASVYAIRYEIKQKAKEISDAKYHYVIWLAKVASTHTCPICTGRKFDNDFGWNCIGYSFALWHHIGLPTKCSCGVISNEVGDKMLKVSDAEALKMAKSRIGCETIQVIKNGGKAISISSLMPGDILMFFKGSEYYHMGVYLGDGKYTDSNRTGGVGSAKNIRTNLTLSTTLKSHIKIAIRYTGTRTYLSRGAEGSAVKKIQAIVGVTADGIFGPATETAVKKYQTVNGLTADGLVGKATLAKMAETPSPSEVIPDKGKVTVPSLDLKKTNAEVIADTIRWAKWIAGDNSFHYGHGKDAHHNGCFFCGTQPKSKKNAGIVDYEKTYCCNPFVGAAWAHGGCDQTALALCRKGKSWGFAKSEGYSKSSLFKHFGKLEQAELKPGDVLCSDTHVALYIGNGKVVQAGHEDDNKKGSSSWNSSIAIGTFKGYKRVHRYIGSVDAKNVLIRFGEISGRVKTLQEALNQIAGKTVCTVDGIFGAGTLQAVKDFQKSHGLTEDGIAGPATIAKMKEVAA